MKQLLCVFGIVALAPEAAAQACVHADLAREFVFTTSLAEAKPAGFPEQDSSTAYSKSCTVAVRIASKSNGRPDQFISFAAGPLLDSAYRRCNAVRSYATGKNRRAEATDNDYGDFVVADFNFDGRDDFAAKNDSGGNAGPLYSYYTQSAAGEFGLDDFLTANMQFFPARIRRARRTLTIHVPAGAYGLGETVFHLDAKTRQWREVSQRILLFY